MKIMFVNKLYPPDVGGGAEIMLSLLAPGVAALGHEVMVVTTTALGSVVQETLDRVPVTRLPLRNIYWHHSGEQQPPLKRLAWHAIDAYNLPMRSALERVMKRFAPDLVSFHNLVGFSSSAWSAARRLGIPALQVLHDYYHLCPRSQLFRNGSNCQKACTECQILRVGRAGASQHVQAVVAVSRATLDAHLSRGLFTSTPLREVIYDARDFAAIVPKPSRDKATTFGFIGTLGEWKGIRQLLLAFRKLTASPALQHLRLLVAGSGEATFVAQLVREFASEHVTFLGHTKKEDFYPQIDVSVVPSLWNEPLGMVAAESLLFGVPVIGARRGGIPEMVVHEQNGLLFDPDDSDQLETCIARLAQVEGLVRELARDAPSSVLKFGDLDGMIQSYVDIYRRILSGPDLTSG